MKTRSFRILLVAAIAAIAMAYLATRNRHSNAESPKGASGAKFFPALVVNDVTKLTVAGPDAANENKVSTFVVTRENDAWGAADKGGYAVDVGKVKQLVLALSEMSVIEEKTKKADQYKKLGVEEITEAEAASKRVTLEDKSGKVVADVLIGKPKVTRNFGGKPSVYVRRFGEAQAYEVNGQVNVDVTAANWLDREISKIESARVREVTTTHTDGTQLVVKKDVPEDQNFAVVGLPEGKELMWPGVANQVAGALQYLSLEDVQKKDGFDFSGATLTEFVTFDGMVVTVKTVEKDGKTWLALSAAYDEAKRTPEAATVEAPPAEGEVKEGETPPETTHPETTPPPTPDPKKPARKSADEVKQEVASLNQKVGPWVYSVPGYNGANFRKHMEDLLKKPEPEVPEGAAPIDDGGLDGGLLPTGDQGDASHTHADGTVHEGSHDAPPPVEPPKEPAQDPQGKPAQPPGGGR
jgi:hypothetical protein